MEGWVAEVVACADADKGGTIESTLAIGKSRVSADWACSVALGNFADAVTHQGMLS